MIRVGATKSHDVLSALRIDSKFFLDDGQLAYLRVSTGRWPMVTVESAFGEGRVWMPGRIRRVVAATSEYGKPILVPYDCFRYLPQSREYLSRSQVKEYSKTEVQAGWLLIVRSGRNLGPLVMADAYLEKFTVSDDMIRISAAPTDDLFYFYALMNTRTGQSIIRRDRNGSVIDHLGPEQVLALRYPVVGSKLKQLCVDSFRKGHRLREQARLSLDEIKLEYLRCLGLTPDLLQLRQEDLRRRFDISRFALEDRTDSEPFAPLYATYRRRITSSKNHALLGDLADVFKPAGRYTTNYVADEAFGVKLLSGRQIAQYKPIAMKIMSERAWDNPEEYVLRKDMVLLTADGRAGENLADCVLVRDDRKGWTASGHVHRLTPKADTNPGLLYLACACSPVQALLKSLATGSVVDALSEADVATLPVPYLWDEEGRLLGRAAARAWDLFSEAAKVEGQAVDLLEGEFAS